MPLHIASQKGQLETVKALIEGRAEVDATNNVIITSAHVKTGGRRRPWAAVTRQQCRLGSHGSGGPSHALNFIHLASPTRGDQTLMKSPNSFSPRHKGAGNLVEGLTSGFGRYTGDPADSEHGLASRCGGRGLGRRVEAGPVGHVHPCSNARVTLVFREGDCQP
jgi:hypothetical protein